MNPPSWHAGDDTQYHEWIDGVGAWELTDPHISTQEQGSALDRIVLNPEWHLPMALLPPETFATSFTDEREEMEHYPAYTFPVPVIADHPQEC